MSNVSTSVRIRLHRRATKKPAFLLLLVMIVVAIASLATLNFSRSMLNSYEGSKLSGGRLQARMCAESGAQAVRLFLANTPTQRRQMGGSWSNPSFFYAKSVIPAPTAQLRGNFSVVSPSLDQDGVFNGIRFGLQNESAKVNLNALVQLDSLVQTGAMATSAVSALTGSSSGSSGSGSSNSGGSNSGGNNSGGSNSGGSNSSGSGSGSSLSGQSSQLASQAGSATSTSTNFARNILMSLPGMTLDLADSLLDWLDEDDEPREYGAEIDYYSTLQPPYKPANGPMESIEQLLLVKGMTPQILYGYDQNRNGYMDPTEQQMQTMGMNPMGGGLGQGNAATLDPNAAPASPLGLTVYLTLHSQEKNIAADGLPRININGDDLTTLYEDLKSVLSEDQASFIIGYRLGGQAKTTPLAALASLVAKDASGETDPSAMGTQIKSLLGASSGASGNQAAKSLPWSVSLLDKVDLTQGGKVKFQQVLDLFDATVTMPAGQTGQGAQGGGQGGSPSYSSPFTSLPVDMASTVPLLMDRLSTTDSKSVPGRINIMECPREILMGIPGLSDDIVQQIIAARNDGSTAETRNFEAWLAIEGYVTIDDLRGLTPLICCGGDVFKAQIVGYLEGDAAFSRIEAIVSGAGDLPMIQFYRRLDHLGRGFSVSTLGQRPDAVILE